jgi:hypothetical protein
MKPNLVSCGSEAFLNIVSPCTDRPAVHPITSPFCCPSTMWHLYQLISSWTNLITSFYMPNITYRVLSIAEPIRLQQHLYCGTSFLDDYDEPSTSHPGCYGPPGGLLWTSLLDGCCGQHHTIHPDCEPCNTFWFCGPHYTLPPGWLQ